MRPRLLAALLLVAAALAGCEPYAGPTANCFTLIPDEAGEGPCDFQPLPGAEAGGSGGA